MDNIQILKTLKLFNLMQLKDICKELNLSSKGSKTQLINRLLKPLRPKFKMSRSGITKTNNFMDECVIQIERLFNIEPDALVSDRCNYLIRLHETTRTFDLVFYEETYATWSFYKDIILDVISNLEKLNVYDENNTWCAAVKYLAFLDNNFEYRVTAGSEFEYFESFVKNIFETHNFRMNKINSDIMTYMTNYLSTKDLGNLSLANKSKQNTLKHKLNTRKEAETLKFFLDNVSVDNATRVQIEAAKNAKTIFKHNLEEKFRQNLLDPDKYVIYNLMSYMLQFTLLSNRFKYINIRCKNELYSNNLNMAIKSEWIKFL